MAWSIRFIPNEVDGISCSINGEHWVTWHSGQGDVNWLLPTKWANNNQIHVYGSAIPSGKNASMKVYWDGIEKQNMDFDDDEDHDVSND